MADSSNTGRNFLLTGALLGIGAAAAGGYIYSSDPIQKIDTNMAGGKTPSLTQEAEQIKADALKVRVVADVAPEGAIIPRFGAKNGGAPRFTPLFFAPKLWRVADKGRDDVRDLLHPNSESVYGSVPNTEFFKYGLESIIGDPDALEQDQDGDGFSNGEELAAGTNPSDSASMPPFMSEDGVKMVAIGRKSVAHTLSLGSMFPYTGEIDISIFQGKGASRNPVRHDQVKNMQEGGTFGLNKDDDKAGPLNKSRFKILSTSGADDTGKFIEIEDSFAKVPEQRTFKLRPGSKDDQMHVVEDVTVSFRLTAGPNKDQELPTPVQLGDTFTVPGFPDVSCTLVKASPKDVRIKIGEKEIRVQNGKNSPNKETK